MKQFYFALPLIVLLISCDTDTALLRWQNQAEDVTIYRDDFGVPHIYGKTDADAVFGMIYAQCEDDFPRVERNYLFAIGRLAEVEGESELYSDVRARLFMSHEEANAVYETQTKAMKKLAEAWADGINYYLHTHPSVKPSLLTKFEPWMTMYFTEGSIGGDIERISTRKLEAFYEGETLAEIESVKADPWEEPKGSNGFAIAGDRTASGDAMLLINPHTSFYFRGETHMVSEEGLNAYGAATWGQFFVYQGFNEKTGWMHTSTYTDVMDEFKETITQEGGDLYYTYGDTLLPVEKIEQTYFVKQDGEILEKTLPTYRTHHGPITQTIGEQWVSTRMMWEPVTALRQSFIRTKQSGYIGFREMMDMKTNSSNNTVYADAEGNIAYFHGNFVPKRDVAFDYSQPVDGTDPATDWQGLHDVEEMIKLLNPSTGWIQNCNSTPFTAAGPDSPKPEDYPYYMASAPENFRGVHAIPLLEQADDVTIDAMISLAYDSYLPAFEKVIPGLIEAFDTNQGEWNQLTEPIKVLRDWDMRTSKESVGMTLAHYYGMALYEKEEIPSDLRGMDRFNYFGTGLDSKKRLAVFSNVIERLGEDFGSWNQPWGDVNRFQRQDGTINMTFDDDKPSIAVGLTTGRWGALAAYGMRGKHETKKIYGTRGNSFIAVVEFGDKVKAKSMLAGGQSGDTSSLHFYDQAQPYADVQFKEVAFYREDVEARAKENYQPGKR
ncbi:MAG: acyl-homoserine-lactone acylase [Cyclobacteriaceae bacterium]|jgi:acyl-homoserine-lactone acylase